MSRQDRTSKAKGAANPGKSQAKTTVAAATPALLQRAQMTPGSLSPNDVKHLQRTIGNRATVGLLSRALPIQTKLTLGPAGDKYEQEADQVAAQVVRQIDSPPAQRQEDEEIQMKSFASLQRQEEDEALQMKPLAASVHRLQRTPVEPIRRAFAIQRADIEEEEMVQGKYEHGPEGGEVAPSVTNQIQAARGGGRPLDDGVRSSMESGFGADFSNVRVHTGTQADTLNRSLNARAFTVGSDIFFKGGEYNPGSSGGKKLLAHELTHTVQQGATSVQRHPSHAEEEEVQAKRAFQAVQRHPSHAEEEEVQAKRIASTPNATGVVQRGPKSWLKKKIKGNKKREQALSAKYGIQIGPGPGGGSHFSDSILSKLDSALSQLPIEHIQGTHLKNIQSGDGIGAASAYTQDSDTAGHIGIVAPNMPEWIYAMLSKGVGWQRKLMDSGAISSLTENVSKSKDKELGLKNSERQVFAGVSDVLSRGNLLSWTVRHEMGHAVDHKIQWTKHRAALPQFGGWRQYDENTVDDFNPVAVALLEKAGISQQTMNHGNYPTLLDTYRRHLKSKGQDPLNQTAVNQSRQQDNGLDQKLEKALRLAQIALAAPWQFSDGGASHLEHNGRVYQLDHYDTWVSYLKAARDANGVSNYQFSTPGEWFAESYAAFYEPGDNSPARARLNDATRNWFLQNLGAPPQPGQQKPAAPGLFEDDGVQAGLRQLAALGAEMKDEIEGGDQADIANVPDDLKSDDNTRLGGF